MLSASSATHGSALQLPVWAWVAVTAAARSRPSGIRGVIADNIRIAAIKTTETGSTGAYGLHARRCAVAAIAALDPTTRRLGIKARHGGGVSSSNMSAMSGTTIEGPAANNGSGSPLNNSTLILSGRGSSSDGKQQQPLLGPNVVVFGAQVDSTALNPDIVLFMSVRTHTRDVAARVVLFHQMLHCAARSTIEAALSAAGLLDGVGGGGSTTGGLMGLANHNVNNNNNTITATSGSFAGGNPAMIMSTTSSTSFAHNNGSTAGVASATTPVLSATIVSTASMLFGPVGRMGVTPVMRPDALDESLLDDIEAAEHLHLGHWESLEKDERGCVSLATFARAATCVLRALSPDLAACPALLTAAAQYECSLVTLLLGGGAAAAGAITARAIGVMWRSRLYAWATSPAHVRLLSRYLTEVVAGDMSLRQPEVRDYLDDVESAIDAAGPPPPGEDPFFAMSSHTPVGAAAAATAALGLSPGATRPPSAPARAPAGLTPSAMSPPTSHPYPPQPATLGGRKGSMDFVRRESNSNAIAGGGGNAFDMLLGAGGGLELAQLGSSLCCPSEALTAAPSIGSARLSASGHHGASPCMALDDLAELTDGTTTTPPAITTDDAATDAGTKVESVVTEAMEGRILGAAATSPMSYSSPSLRVVPSSPAVLRVGVLKEALSTGVSEKAENEQSRKDDGITTSSNDLETSKQTVQPNARYTHLELASPPPPPLPPLSVDLDRRHVSPPWRRGQAVMCPLPGGGCGVLMRPATPHKGPGAEYGGLARVAQMPREVRRAAALTAAIEPEFEKHGTDAWVPRRPRSVASIMRQTVAAAVNAPSSLPRIGRQQQQQQRPPSVPPVLVASKRKQEEASSSFSTSAKAASPQSAAAFPPVSYLSPVRALHNARIAATNVTTTSAAPLSPERATMTMMGRSSGAAAVASHGSVAGLLTPPPPSRDALATIARCVSRNSTRAASTIW